jgi:hypothetical protein
MPTENDLTSKPIAKDTCRTMHRDQGNRRKRTSDQGNSEQGRRPRRRLQQTNEADKRYPDGLKQHERTAHNPYLEREYVSILTAVLCTHMTSCQDGHSKAGPCPHCRSYKNNNTPSRCINSSIQARAPIKSTIWRMNST